MFSSENQSVDETQNDTETSVSQGRMSVLEQPRSLSKLKAPPNNSQRRLQVAEPFGEDLLGLDEEDEEEGQTSAETSSTYHIHKILSDDKYTIGKTVATFVTDFQAEYSNLKDQNLL